MTKPESYVDVQGYINDVAYTLSGPPELVDATINFIRNLVKMHKGVGYINKELRVSIKQKVN